MESNLGELAGIAVCDSALDNSYKGSERRGSGLTYYNIMTVEGYRVASVSYSVLNKQYTFTAL